ncbi:hypothetical protein [Paenibacillus alvei]|uniref:hypothetical protein n=1 Tax=Paenibacillus alvei TaxID=44250 RepID=UPI001F509A42|nr:hypothetical protein [Paenibacillus alvei]MBG9737116.1 hypothetical protein [Paenibacillus alvei]MBG9742774.1 hypothetical protein [Paenibacillus alvei]MBG9746209.1 hypothetical protein [Paenibacillus alvei]MCY9579682.1 hypothetical protein [Paenibacillus alvei]MCY9586336.1 hypothetical protein [Paenibacillus alvei]
MNRDRMNSAMQDWMDKQKKQVITGQLVVEDEKVSLQLEDGSLIELSPTDRIEVKNGERFEPAPYSRIIEIVDSGGWPIYAGLYASVHQPIKKVDIRTALWNEISDTCEEIYEGIIGDVDGAIKIQEAVKGYLNACCTERVQIHANPQAALAESQGRVQNLSHPRNEDMNMMQCGNEKVHLEPGAVAVIGEKEGRIHMDTMEVIDHCPVCEEEIFFGQPVWKVGREFCCSVPCMVRRVQVKVVIAGKDEHQHADS